MFKKRVITIVACFLILLSTSIAIEANPIITPTAHSSGTGIMIGGSGFTSIDVILSQIALDAVAITGTAEATLNSDVTSITITSGTGISLPGGASATATHGLSAILVSSSGTAPTFDTASLTIAGTTNETLSINLGGSTRASGILIENNGHILVEKNLNISHTSYGTGIALYGTPYGVVTEEIATFKGNVDITFDGTNTGTRVNGDKTGLRLYYGIIATIEGDLNITVDGADSSYGINAGNSASAAITGLDPVFTVKGDTTIAITGNASWGAHFNGNSGKSVFEKDLVISANGVNNVGVFKTNGAMVEVLGDLDITMLGSGTTTNIAGLFITTNSSIPAGAKAFTVLGKTTIDSSGYYVQGAQIANSIVEFGEFSSTTRGDRAYGLYITNTTAVFGDTTVKTLGDGSVAVYLSGTPSSTGHTFGKLNVSTEGENLVLSPTQTVRPYAFYLALNANALVQDVATISTMGDGAHALLLTAGTVGTGVVFEKNADISTDGDDAYALVLYDRSTIKFLDGGSIITTGADAIPIVFAGVPTDVFFNSVTIGSADGLALVSLVGGNIVVDFSGSSELIGSVYNQETGPSTGVFGTIQLNLDDTSFWRGGSENAVGEGSVDLVLDGSAYWDIADDYRVDSIKMLGSNNKILFSYLTPNTYYTATIGEITGNATFVLNVDMSGATGQGDMIVIDKATGTFLLDIVDKSAAAAVANDLDVITIADITGAPSVSLLNSTGVMLGGSLYILKVDSAGTTWSLVKDSIPGPIITGTNTSLVGLFELAKAVDASISDELLSAKKTVWVVAGYKRQNFRGLPTNDDLKQNIFNLITGMDVASKDDWNFGVFIGLTVGNQDVNAVIVSTTDAFTLGANAIYEKDGLLASGYVRVASYLHRIEVINNPNLMTGRMSTFGISASAQAMKSFYIAETGIFVAPKAKLSFTHVFGFNHDFNLLTVTGKSNSALVAWIGARVGADIFVKEIPVTPYVEAGFIFDTNQKITVTIANNEEEVELSGARYEFGAGVDMKTAAEANFTIEYKFSISKNLVEPVKIKISATTSF